MPICLDPESNFEVCLKSDESKPINARPVFVCKHITGREAMRIANMADDKERHWFEVLFDVARLRIVGWKHMGRDYDPATLEDVLTVQEVQELVNTIAAQSGVQSDDLGKSESQPPSEPGASAISA